MDFIVGSLIASIVALFTGIIAVGNGSKFQFSKMDILHGKRNAILYIWVTLSSMFSLAHVIAVANYVHKPIWGHGEAIQMWFAIHMAVGLLLIAAHGYIHRSLTLDPAKGDEYLW